MQSIPHDIMLILRHNTVPDGVEGFRGTGINCTWQFNLPAVLHVKVESTAMPAQLRVMPLSSPDVRNMFAIGRLVLLGAICSSDCYHFLITFAFAKISCKYSPHSHIFFSKTINVGPW